MPPHPAKLKAASRRVARTSPSKKDSARAQTVDRSTIVAACYGFFPLTGGFRITSKDSEAARTILGGTVKQKTASMGLPTAEEHAVLLRYFEERKLGERPLPALLYALTDPLGDARKKRGEKRLILAVMGSNKSIVEALLIQTARAILAEEGYPSLCVSINSVGDRESTSRFFRECTAYYRKNLDRLPAPCRALLQKNQMVLSCDHEKCRLVAVDSPKSIACLSEQSRAHLKEVLEYLEELKIPYRIDHTLLGSVALQNEIIFEIFDATAEAGAPALAAGARQNGLARRIGSRRDLPYACAAVTLSRAGATKSFLKKRGKRPTLFFLQLGADAKLKSLGVIEALRREHIPVCHAIARDKLLSQLSVQEHSESPYSIIMGQREALENSVIVRNTETRAQETVKIAELPAYLKRHQII